MPLKFLIESNKITWILLIVNSIYITNVLINFVAYYMFPVLHMMQYVFACAVQINALVGVQITTSH